MSLTEELTALKASAVERINAADADIEALRVSLLGKKGELTALRTMNDLVMIEQI
ncbi:hypothetical protein GQS40_03365|uniref:Phenylalanine-tRNA ligase class II N-terminal domain-containing protein n=1 Tax=Leuconostoc lactis TaxID=1246 RepID=A0A6L7A936_LEULA|nr:hypothetical protein [Leuconostoc lactis]